MRKMGLNKNYVVGIYNDTSFSSHMSESERLKELTEFFTRFKYFGPIIAANSVNEVLDKALKHGVKYCIVQATGHIIQEAAFFRHIEKWIEKQNFFVTGHIMDKNKPNKNNPKGAAGYYGLHKQCMLVNLDYYKKFDKPVFGDKSSTKEEMVIKAKRHSKDIHDDYTPLSLMPTEESTICTPLVDGWNFINVSLENDLTVYNFHPKIRESKQYIYPSLSAEELATQLSWIQNIVEYAPTCVFLWNTENYLDLKYIKLNKPIKKLYSVAASFKPNMILHHFGFTNDTEVVYYDYSKPALAFKKLLLTQWNGEDYPSFIKWALAKYQFSETGGVETETLTRDELWQREIKFWGSEKSIKDHWLMYKELKHSFTHVDICENPEKIINKITDEPDSVIWWSNAFHTVNAQYVRGLQGVKDCYNKWLKLLNSKNTNIWILGKDYLDKPVEGNTLKEYLNEYHL
tara:strand:- start:676 stop:2049 length:1374 start_codon:yes stop_codon:yes gene_type:complete